MNKQYFPGANSGSGFYSRFEGIVPPWEAPHYTYILKGGPGVGKNTLMKTVAERAAAQGYEIEEFRCASDPDSFDALRIPALRLVLMDGTAPHMLDPVMPGVREEIVDLGHFLRHEEFMNCHDRLKILSAQNAACYNRAYACLGSARALKESAVQDIARRADLGKIRAFLRQLFSAEASGACRRLFIRSATPAGVKSFSETLGITRRITLPDLSGTLILREALTFATAKNCEVFFDFITPEIPYMIVLPVCGIALCNDGTQMPTELALSAKADSYTEFVADKINPLVDRAVTELRFALQAHDEIEMLYRPFVDYDRVNAESAALLARIGL